MDAREMERMLRERAVVLHGYGIVPYSLCRDVAALAGVSWLEMEVFALEHGLCPSRYERTIGTIGMQGQKRLLESHVAVVGCGGLGGLLVELLARAGVGHLVLIDRDAFAESNLNRQILGAEKDAGRTKASVARERALEINGALDVTSWHRSLDGKSVREMLEGVSLVIDALDNNSTRIVLLRECRRRGIPFVHAAIGGFWAQVGVFMPGDRSLLDILEDVPDRGVETETGNPPFTPAFAASLQATLAIRLLSGAEDVEHGVLYWCDLSEFSIRKLKL